MKRVLLILIAIRILCYSAILYETILNTIDAFNSNQTTDFWKNVLIRIIAVLTITLLLDVITFYILKKEIKFYTRYFVLLSSFISILISTFSIGVLFLYSFFASYTLLHDLLIMLVVLGISIFNIVGIFTKQIKKTRVTPKFAEPVMQVDQFSQDHHTNPQSEDKN